MSCEEASFDDYDGARAYFHCWCGESGAYEDLCNDDDLGDDCEGHGEFPCYCGGDLCVCHHHGSIPCPGCESCERSDGDEDDYHDFDE